LTVSTHTKGLQGLTDIQLRQVRELQKLERDKRIHARPAAFFPWHVIQKFILGVADTIVGDVRIIFIAGGNRGGKSKAAMGVLSELLRRVSGFNKQLMTMDSYTRLERVKNDRDPLTIWVAPPTLEKARLDWLAPQDQMGLKYWCGDLYVTTKKSPDLVIYCRPPGVSEEEIWDSKGKLLPDFDLVCDKIIMKSQDQKLETFESSEVDMVIFDEEVGSKKIFDSCLMRIATTHGFILMAYTPLRGLSWSFKTYWKPFVKDGLAKKVADRCWTREHEVAETVVCAQLGSADNPRAAKYAAEIEAGHSMSEAEKAARLHGEYGYVEGALIEALAGLDVKNPLEEHAIYVVDELPKKLRNWFLVSDPNKSYGAVLSARDDDGNLFFVAEHLEEAWADRLHAAAFKDMERTYVTGTVYRYADPGSAGAQSIVNMSDLGIDFNTMPKGAGSVSASVKKLRGLTYVDPAHQHPFTGDLGAPRVYFYRPGLVGEGKNESELANQISEARQTDNESAAPDTPHKDIRSRLDLFDCARYTAVVADHVPVHGGLPEFGLGAPQEDIIKMPTKEEWMNPLDSVFDIPEYDFGGTSW